MLLLAFGACVAFCTPTLALPWLITSYVEVRISTLVTATTLTDISITEAGVVETDIVQVIPTISAFPTLSIVTTVDNVYTDLTEVEILVPTGVGSSVTFDPFDNPTKYYIELVYSAPTTCKSKWTLTTTAPVDAPYMITFAPTSVSTLTTVPRAFGGTITSYLGFVNPTDIPADALSSLSSDYNPYYSTDCSIPYYYTAIGTAASPSATTTSGSSSGDSSNSDDDPAANGYADCDPFWWTFAGATVGSGYICPSGTYYTHGMTITNFVITWIFTWFGVFLIIGCIESYINFSKLARGRKARRGTPVAFACLAPLLSCLCLCFRNPGYTAKSPEEQARLTEQWNATPFFTRIGRWLKWGFRFKYPPFLGDAPTRRAHWGGGKKGINTNSDGRGAIIVPRETVGEAPVPVAEMEHRDRNEIYSPEVTYGGGDQKGFHVSSV